MAIARRATAVPGSTTNTTSFTITIPASTATDDLLFIVFTSRGHTSGTAQPTCTDNDTGGNTWTRITNSTDRKAQIFWKRATSATASKTITVSGCVTSTCGVLHVYSGGSKETTPYANGALETNASGDKSHAAITPTAADAMTAFAVFNYAGNNAVTSVSQATGGSMSSVEHTSSSGSGSETSFSSLVQVGEPATTGAITWAQTNATTYSYVLSINPDAQIERPGVGAATVTGLVPVTVPNQPIFAGDSPARLGVIGQYPITVNSTPSAALMDSYAQANEDSNIPLVSGSEVKIGQVTTGNGGTLDSAKFALARFGSPTGNIVVEIYAATGTKGTDAVGTGSVLATSDGIDVSTLSTTTTFVSFTFSGANRITLTNATNYVVAAAHAGTDINNNVEVHIDISSPTHAGNYASYNGSWGANNGFDVPFELYTASAANTIKQPYRAHANIVGLGPIATQARYIAVSQGGLTIAGLLPTRVENSIRLPGAGSVLTTGQVPLLMQSYWIAGGLGALAATGQLPIRIEASIRTPGIATATTAGLLPTRVENSIRLPGAGSALATGQVPLLMQSYWIAGGLGALAATGQLPIRIENSIRTPGIQALTVSGLVPSVVITLGNIVALPGAGAATISGQVPLLMQSYWIAGGLGAATISGQAPLMMQSYWVAGGLGAATIAGVAPTLFEASIRLPNAGQAVLTTYTPLLLGGNAQAAQPGVGAATITGLAPTIPVFVSPTNGALSIGGLAPTVFEASIRLPGVAALTINALTLTRIEASIRMPGVGAAAITGLLPTRFEQSIRLPGVASLTVNGLTPSTGGTAVIVVGVGSIVASGTVPVAFATFSASPANGAVSVQGYAPFLFNPQQANPILGSATIVGRAPTVAINNAINVGVGSVSVTGQQPFLAPRVGASVLTVNGLAPTLRYDLQAFPNAGAIGITGLVPSIPRLISVGEASLTVVGRGPLASQIATFRASEITSDSGGAATSLTASKPVGIQNRDFMLAVVNHGSRVNSALTAPDGWTLLTSMQGAQANGLSKAWIYWKEAGNSEPDNYTWTWTTACEVQIAILGYYSSGNIRIDTWTKVEHTFELPPWSAPSLYPSRLPTRLVNILVGGSWAVYSGFTPPAGMDERIDSSIGNNCAITVADSQWLGIEATGTRLYDNGDAGDDNAALSLLLFIVETYKTLPASGSLSVQGLAPVTYRTNPIPIAVGSIGAFGRIISSQFGFGIGAQALALTGLAPNNFERSIRMPSVGQASLIGYAPLLRSIALPGASTLSIISYAPSVSIDYNINTGVGISTVTGLAPRSQMSIVLSAGIGAVTATGQGVGIGPYPGLGSVSLTTLMPVAVVNSIQTPASVALVVTTYAPQSVAIHPSVGLMPDLGSASIATYAPTTVLTLSRIVDVPVLDMQIYTQLVRSINNADHYIEVEGVATLTTAGLSVVYVDQTVDKGALAIVGQSVGLNFKYALSVGQASLIGYAPNVGRSSPVMGPNVASASLTGYAGTLRYDTRLSPGVGTLVAIGYGINTKEPVYRYQATVTGYAPVSLRDLSRFPVNGAVSITGLAANIVLTSPIFGQTNATNLFINLYAPSLVIQVETFSDVTLVPGRGWMNQASAQQSLVPGDGFIEDEGQTIEAPAGVRSEAPSTTLHFAGQSVSIVRTTFVPITLTVGGTTSVGVVGYAPLVLIGWTIPVLNTALNAAGFSHTTFASDFRWRHINAGQAALATYDASLVLFHGQTIVSGTNLVIEAFPPVLAVSNHLRPTVGVGSITVTGFDVSANPTGHWSIQTPKGSASIDSLVPDVVLTLSYIIDGGSVAPLGIAMMGVSLTRSENARCDTSVGQASLIGYEPLCNASNHQWIDVTNGASSIDQSYIPATLATDHHWTSVDSINTISVNGLGVDSAATEHHWTNEDDIKSYSVAGYEPSLRYDFVIATDTGVSIISAYGSVASMADNVGTTNADATIAGHAPSLKFDYVISVVSSSISVGTDSAPMSDIPNDGVATVFERKLYAVGLAPILAFNVKVNLIEAGLTFTQNKLSDPGFYYGKVSAGVGFPQALIKDALFGTEIS